jgi:plasmid segregation protein ParM
MGTITLYSRIQDALQKSDILLSDELITDAICGEIQHTDSKQIAAVVDQTVAAYCKELFNALRERGLDLKLPTVFAGGGAELLESRLYDDNLNTVAVLNRFANADGYKLLMG